MARYSIKLLFFVFFLLSPWRSWCVEKLELCDNHLDPHLMQKLIRLFSVSNLIETGTSSGDTAENSAMHFQKVYTVEFWKAEFEYAQRRLSKYPNVYCYENHSADFLKDIIPLLSGRSLFWLDAHWSGGAVKWLKNTAIREELASIRDSGLKDGVILIDDIRCFHELPEEIPCFGGFPSARALKKEVLEINPSYDFWILGDVAIAFPKQDQVEVSDLVRACTISRLFEGDDSEVYEVIEAEETILSSFASLESKCIDALYRKCVALDEDETDQYMVHILTWEGLLQLGRGECREALTNFERVIRAGYGHWRIYWYKAMAAYLAHELKKSIGAIESIMSLAPNFQPAAELLIHIQRECKNETVDCFTNKKVAT
jgi:hypothetical protein